MKKAELVFSAITVPLDASMIVAAGCAAYFLRFQTLTDLWPVLFQIPFSQYLFFIGIFALYSTAVFACAGLYAIRRWKIHNEFQRIFVASSASVMLLIVTIFFRQEFFSSRFIVLAVWLLMIVLVLSGRGVLRVMRIACFYRGIGLHSVALVGQQERIAQLQSFIETHLSLGYRIVATSERLTDDFKELCMRLKSQGKLDELIVVSSQAHQQLELLAELATYLHIDFEYSSDMISVGRLQSTMIAGLPFVEVRRTRLQGWWRIVKRMLDVIGSCICILLFLPLMVLISAWIRYSSKGPIIYKDVRVGQRGLFHTYKFRTMYIQFCTGPGYDNTGSAEKLEEKLISEKNERQGPVPKVLNDPRRTPVGRILERTSLDELPQFFNVFLGNMSLVGPRPHRPKEVAGYDISHHRLFSVKPGITGLAQISGRSDLDFSEEVKLDTFYIENWSLYLDCAILFKTPWAVLSRKSRV
ncbi:MAG: sugar transferase [Patescibacteria group bacterium]